MRLTASTLNVHLPDDIPEHINLPLFAPDFRLRNNNLDSSVDDDDNDDNNNNKQQLISKELEEILIQLENRMKSLTIE